MTPAQCLAARARLGWSREDLARASSLATPIVRLYEAGALDGFDDCEAAIAEAFHNAARRPSTKRAIFGAVSWLSGRTRLMGLVRRGAFIAASNG